MAENLLGTPARPPTPAQPYRLLLFVAGNELNSTKARQVLAHVCEQHLKGRHELRIVDILEDYQAAITHQVIVVPTLIVETPTRKTVLFGSLSDREKLLLAIDVSTNGEVRP